MRRVLFDSDVLLDVLMERQPFVISSAKALTWATIPGNEGMVAGHAITNIFYILRRKVSREEAIRLISTILQILKVASVTESVISVALKSTMIDFEDAVTSTAADSSGAEVIITRNGSDFAQSKVLPLSPDEFLEVSFVSNNSGSISQSNSGSIAGGMQASIGNNINQVMSTETSSASNIPTQAEVVELLAQIERIIQNAELPETATSKASKYIEAAKIEAEESEPDKQLISKNLGRVTKNLEEVDRTVDASKRIFEKVTPLLMRIASWLGMAISSL